MASYYGKVAALTLCLFPLYRLANSCLPIVNQRLVVFKIFLDSLKILGSRLGIVKGQQWGREYGNETL